MEIRLINKEEIAGVVNVHLKAFEGFFLSDLGGSFLKTYYDSIRKNDRGILLGSFENERLIGFCAGTSLSDGFNAYLIRRNFLQFSITGITLLFSKPRALYRLYKNLKKTGTSITDSGNYAELLSIGIDPNFQGKGVGKRLLIQLELMLAKQGQNQISLTTDLHNNENSLQFYKSLDYDILYDFVAWPNRKMYRLIKNI